MKSILTLSELRDLFAFFPLLFINMFLLLLFFLVVVSFLSACFLFLLSYTTRHKENERFFLGASFNSRLSELESPHWVSEPNLSFSVEA